MDILQDPVVTRAARFAQNKHAHQTRMDGKTPYFSHLDGVARIIAEVYPDVEMVAAGYLHDTIEDTNTDYDKLESRFGPKVADIVSVLSMDNRLKEEERLSEYRERLRKASLQAAIVKTADILHNAKSLGDAIAKAFPDFEQKVLRKWSVTLGVLWDAHSNAQGQGDLGMAFLRLYERAQEILAKRAGELGIAV